MLQKLNIDATRPVVVFASYRTGSTAFCDYISHKHQLINFDEAFHWDFPWRTADFIRQSLTTNFVIKIMPDQYQNYKSIIDFLIEECSCNLIRLTRNNFVEQVASWYVASTSDNWHNTGHDNNHYSVPIVHKQIIGCTDFIEKQNLALEKINFNFSNEIEYSELGSIDSKYRVYNKPTNYATLLEEIRKVI